MKYMGSKRRIAKYILPIMLEGRKDGQWWVEPFVGGANMIDKVDGNRLGADSNEYLIALLKKMQGEQFSAPEVTKELFCQIKENKHRYHDWLVGYAGTQLSFGSMWFGSYRQDNKGVRNYSSEAASNVDKQSKKIKGIEFTSSKYQRLEVPPESVIYCDPPYEGTASYKAVDKFNHPDFWQWCREKSEEGHTVFISEYNAPDDFECIWQQELNVTVAKNGKNKKAVEKLFRIKS
jgi:DNA adenine methylase